MSIKAYKAVAKAAHRLLGELASRFDYETLTPEEEAAFCKLEYALTKVGKKRHPITRKGVVP